jgi:hypothetical protein
MAEAKRQPGRDGGLRTLIERLRRLGGIRAGDGSGAGDRIGLLERRLAHLEAVVEGLQDGVHRDSVRQNEQIAELQHRIAPDEMARQLSDDARRRGL